MPELRRKEAYLRCECGSETLWFQRTDFGGETDYEVTIEDGYCCGDFMGIKGRFKRAWHAFWAKPICYTSILVTNQEQMWAFLEECERIATGQM